MSHDDFFTEYGEASRFKIHEVIGKGSYGVVCSATDSKTGTKVAIKKITDVFEHVSDATRILREVKLLRVLKHPDIVEVKHIVLPPNPREFKDIFVIFELMETDLHQVIKANDDLTHEHHQFFLYQVRDSRRVDASLTNPHRPLISSHNFLLPTTAFPEGENAWRPQILILILFSTPASSCPMAGRWLSTPHIRPTLKEHVGTRAHPLRPEIYKADIAPLLTFSPHAFLNSIVQL